MKIERIQYDGAGQWLDIVFSDGERYRLSAPLLRKLCELAGVALSSEFEFRKEEASKS